jgi:hypothetical protein
MLSDDYNRAEGFIEKIDDAPIYFLMLTDKKKPDLKVNYVAEQEFFSNYVYRVGRSESNGKQLGREDLKNLDKDISIACKHASSAVFHEVQTFVQDLIARKPDSPQPVLTTKMFDDQFGFLKMVKIGTRSFQRKINALSGTLKRDFLPNDPNIPEKLHSMALQWVNEYLHGDLLEEFKKADALL